MATLSLRHRESSRKPAPSLNLRRLDSLVLSYLHSDNLVEDDTLDSESKQTRDRCEAVRQLAASGDLVAALDLAEQTAAGAVTGDPRLLFRVYKQAFVEILRDGTESSALAAIEWARTKLAPLALGAYPEAYAEFKRCMLLLVLGPGAAAASPVAVEQWSPSSRCDLAALLFQTLRQATLRSARDPTLVTLLQHLLNTMRVRADRARGGAAPGAPTPSTPAAVAEAADAALAAELLCPDRDPPPLPRDATSGAPTYPEAEVQHLALSLGISRQAAVEALKHAGGDTPAAFRAELLRLRLRGDALDALISEYALHRGLVTQGGGGRAGGRAPGGAPERFYGLTTAGDSENGVQASTVATAGGGSGGGALGRSRPTDTVPPGGWGGASPGSGARAAAAAAQGPRVWRGRHNPWLVSRPPTPPVVVAMDTPMADAPHPAADAPPPPTRPYATLVDVRSLLVSCRYAEAVAVAESACPGFWAAHPSLRFDVSRGALLALAASGDATGALALARAELGPLAQQCPTLLPLLQPALLAVLRPEAAAAAAPSIDTLAAAVSSSLQAALGLQEPRLARLLRAALAAHSDWFRRNYSEDPFRQVFGGALEALKEPEAEVTTATPGMDVSPTPALNPLAPPFDPTRVVGGGATSRGGDVVGGGALTAEQTDDARRAFAAAAARYAVLAGRDDPGEAEDAFAALVNRLATEGRGGGGNNAAGGGNGNNGNNGHGAAPPGVHLLMNEADDGGQYAAGPGEDDDGAEDLPPPDDDGGRGDDDGQGGDGGGAGDPGAPGGAPPLFDERAVVTLQEFIAVSREDAVALLTAYGSVELAMHHVLQ